jgi:hypothetical protein
VNEPDFRPGAHAIRQEWSDERLDVAARARVVERVAGRQRTRGRRRRRVRRGAALSAAVVAIGIPAAVAAGLLSGERSAAPGAGGRTAAPAGSASAAPSPVVERVAAVMRPRNGGIRYRARVRRTDGPPARSTIAATIFYADRRARYVERDAAGRVFIRAASSPDRTVFRRRGERPIRLPRYFGVAPDYLDAAGLRALRRSSPGTSVSGPRTVSGRTAYVLSWKWSDRESTWRHVLTVDARTYEPIRHERTMLRGARYLVSPRAGDRVVTAIESFDRVR